jgi:fructosamine-3-kinase
MSLADRAAALVDGKLSDWSLITNGGISAVYRMTLRDGRALIVKSAPTASSEAAMLRAIEDTGTPCPTVLGKADDLLVMEEVQTGGRLRATVWSNLAEVLRTLHAASATVYGWPIDHAFAGVAIPNAASNDWPGFWADRRLRCHLPYIDRSLGKRLEQLADRIDGHLPAHPRASLLHGDLWGGNILVLGDKIAALIDPACYHGDREVDVAMLTMFDDPPAAFFDALDLGQGWRQRLPVYRLWPALVHLRLFGSAYSELTSRTLAELGA